MKNFLAATLLVALCGACLTTKAERDWAAGPEDSLLVDVSPAEKTRVSTARVAQGKAQDVLAAAQRQHDLAVSDQQTGKQQHRASVDQVAWTKTALANSETTGTTTDVEAAKEAVRVAENARDVQVAHCELRDLEVTEAQQQAALANTQVAVASARLELAKSVAISTLDRPDAQKPDIPRYEAAVREAEGRENIARAGLAAAAREVVIGRSKLAERERVR